jgi:hypothetical protein
LKVRSSERALPENRSVFLMGDESIEIEFLGDLRRGKRDIHADAIGVRKREHLVEENCWTSKNPDSAGQQPGRNKKKAQSHKASHASNTQAKTVTWNRIAWDGAIRQAA